MVNKNYLSAVAEIDETLIARSEKTVNTTSTFKKIWIPVAASLTLAAAVFGILLLGPNTIFNKYTIVNQYEEMANSYIPPVPGEYYCFVNVDKAREANLHRNVDYMLAFDLFNETEITPDEELAEYQRMIDEGYRLYKVPYWTYEGEGEKVYKTAVVGLFSEKELASFKVNPAYGYAFHFIHNGDGSGILIEEGEKMD